MIYIAVAIVALLIGIVLSSWAAVSLRWLHERQLDRETLVVADLLYQHEPDPTARLCLCVNDLAAPAGIFWDKSERERTELIHAALRTMDAMDRERARYSAVVRPFHIDGKAPLGTSGGAEPKLRLNDDTDKETRA